MNLKALLLEAVNFACNRLMLAGFEQYLVHVYCLALGRLLLQLLVVFAVAVGVVLPPSSLSSSCCVAIFQRAVVSCSRPKLALRKKAATCPLWLITFAFAAAFCPERSFQGRSLCT